MHRFNLQPKVPPIPLRLLLTLPFVVQVTGVVGVVGYLSYRHGQQTIETMAYALMNQVGQRVTQELDHYLQAAHQFNQAQVAAVVAQAIDPQDLDQLHRYMILQHRQAESLTTVLFGNPQGDFRISHHVSPKDYGVNTQLQPGEIPIEAGISEAANPSTNRLYGVDGAGQLGRYLETIENMDVRDRPWYRQAVTTGAPGWIGPYQLGSTNLLTLNAHVPLYDQGDALLGVFAVNITLNQLGDFLADLAVGKTGEVVILERNGLVVATSTGDGPYAITSTPNAESRTPPGELGFERLKPTDLDSPTIQRAYAYLTQYGMDLASLQSPQAIHASGPGTHDFITVVPYRNAHGLDWLVMTVIPKADFTAEMQQTLIHTGVLCLLALVGAIASGLVIAKRVTKHITRLTQASAALAAGDLTQQVPATSPIIETKALALAFNQMADQLRQLFQSQVDVEATRQSEAQFQRLAAAVPGMIYTYTLHTDGLTRFDYVSSASQSILELTPEQIVADAETVLAQIHPEDRPSHDAAVADSADTLKPFSLAFRNITPSGQLKWLEASSQPIRRSDGSVTWYGLLLDVSDRKQFEADLQLNAQKLADSEARFQKMAATLPGILYSSIVKPDESTQFIYGSAAASELLEVEVEAALADASVIFNLYHPDDRAGFVAARNYSVATHQPFRHEWRVITPSGKTKWLQVNARHERLPNQDILWFGVVLDISDRKAMEVALRQSEARYLSILDEQTELITRFQSDGTLVFVNDAFCRYYGLSKPEVIGQPYQPRVYATDQTLIDQALAQLSPENPIGMVEHRAIVKGDVRWMQWINQGIYDDQGTLLELQSVGRDIHDLKQAELALKESEARFWRLSNASPANLYILVMHPDGTFQFEHMSQAVEAMHGLRVADILADAAVLLDGIHPEDRAGYNAAVQCSINTLAPFEHEWRIITPSGAVKWLQGRSQPQRRENGDIVWYGVVIDISDRKAAEAALQQAHQQLEVRLADLRQRNEDMVLLSTMSDFLQACLTLDEAYVALADLLQPLFPDCTGGIFTTPAPGRPLEAQATWGHPLRSEPEFRRTDCWALRRGRGYWVPAGQTQRHCQHVIAEAGVVTLCIPMMAQGEISGLLYLSAVTPAALPVAKRQLAHAVAEQIALAISNLHLRETLREQSIRDPLTGLYNRRYLEEALQHEMASAQRHQTTIGVIMLDADHFKSFNDTYGHDFGDQVLQAIAQVLKGGTRLSDLACRYGGEEFTLILPQTSLADTATRAEALRHQIGQLTFIHGGQPVPTITASLGVACFPQHGQTGAELLQKADQALYQAKAAGRNRVLCAPLEPGVGTSP